ncbi:MAG: hypothetical protein H6Q48_4322 [Deltaproteobacteria bacterium]|nr:hypothetical protein [Deltaproteobacteria bacterium]
MSFVHKRLVRMSLSTVVMILCFPLYYLGLFGSVEGPLNPARIGDSLAGMGVTKTHSLVFFLSFLIIAVSWNWIYNIVSLLLGSRLTCNKLDEEGKPCGARVQRKKAVQKKTGQKVAQYVCANGHKRPDAHFHPIRKGMVSHTVWLVALTFCVVVFLLS